MPEKGKHMRKNNLIITVNFIVTSIMVSMFIFYWTEWGRDYLPVGLLWFWAGLTILTAGALMVTFFTKQRDHSLLNAISSNLQLIAQSPDETLEIIKALPVGSHTESAAVGWNILLAAIDQLRSEIPQNSQNSDIGRFLCSYDSQRLLILLDSLPDGIILADAEGNVILANRSCEGLLGKSLSEFIGRSVTELFDNEIAAQQMASFRQPASALSDNFFEINLGDESDRSVLCVYCRRISPVAQNSEIMIIVRDVSQQKISDSSRENFIAHVSHELRSPLTNIRAYAETLLSDMVLDAATQKEAFNVINEETGRLIRLVNDVLELSRMETGSMTLDKGEVVMDRLIRQCVNDVKGAAAGKKISLQTNYHPKLTNLSADREKLNVVFNNILTNAIKYTPDGGTILVETNMDDSFVYIKVADTGFGIEPEDIDRIFEKFYRIERKETSHITGTGLGLAISKEIVVLHGGEIEVNSEPNSGTEMIIKLPLTVTGPVLGPANN